MNEPVPAAMDRREVARRLLATPPQTTTAGPSPERQAWLHHIAVRLLTGYRDAVLLDYQVVRQAIRHDGWATVRVDWQQLARLADDMGARGTDRQHAAYQAGAFGTAVRYVRYILTAAAGIALGEITPEEAQALADAFTALSQPATRPHDWGEVKFL